MPTGTGIARTPIGGLTLIRQATPTALQYAIANPLIALVLQGSKRVSIGSNTFDFGAGESLLIAADVPTISQITRANNAAPYFSIVVDLDVTLIEGLVAEMGVIPFAAGAPVRVGPTDEEAAEHPAASDAPPRSASVLACAAGIVDTRAALLDAVGPSWR